MGCLRLVGSLKLQVSFAEYRLFLRALLQKRPVILDGMSSLDVWTSPTSREDLSIDRVFGFLANRG